MDQIKKYWPTILIILFAVVVTGIAAYTQGSESHFILGSDEQQIPYWLTPIGYLLIAIIAKKGVKELNNPLYVLVALVVYTISSLALFFPLPHNLPWHFIVGVPTVAFIIWG